MANSILTPTQVTREAVRILHQKLNFVGSVNRQYDDSFAKSGAKIGDSLKIRMPNQYTVRSGATLSTQDTAEASETLQVSTQKGVDVTFSSAELTLDLDNFASRILEPAMSVLAANIEADAMNMYKDVFQQVNNQGSSATFAKLMQARKQLNDSLAPTDDNRTICLNTQDNVDLVDALKGLFQDSSAIQKQYRDGLMGRTAGFNFYENTLLPRHTVGTKGGTPLVNGASQTGSTLVTDGWNASETVLKKGDVFTIAGVYSVHPETKQSTGALQQFVATADIVSDGAGAASITISPAIVTTGAKQNVSGSPADNAAITVAGVASTAHGISLAFHRDAFAFATADLEDVSKYGAWGAREMFDGISIRIARQYAISSDTVPCRIDVIYGYKTIRPQLASRLANN